jgi:hypothetical protein
MHADVAIDELRDVDVHRDARQHVGVIAAEMLFWGLGARGCNGKSMPGANRAALAGAQANFTPATTLYFSGIVGRAYVVAANYHF